MTRSARLVLLAGICLFASRAAAFTRLEQLPAPQITDSATAIFLHGSAPVENLVDGDPKTEFASKGEGLETFVEFTFDEPTLLAGFRHQDRRIGTIAGSELILYALDGRELRRLEVGHEDRGGSVAFRAISPAVKVKRVRWQVTRLGRGKVSSVGGAEVAFYGPGREEAVPRDLKLDPVALPVATKSAGDGLRQPWLLTIDSPYVEGFAARVEVAGMPARDVTLHAGPQILRYEIPTSGEAHELGVTVRDEHGAVLTQTANRVPAFRKMTVYILPHSHVDIGFTEIQTGIEEKQLHNLLAGIAAAKRTADYPEGSRFVWNLEGLWPADLLLRRLTDEQRQSFFEAVRRHQVGINGLYFNALTGLCRPEELVRLFSFGMALKDDIGVPLDSAMISDVPGYTWGVVPAMAEAGIKYFSAAPNIFDRIGETYVQWENRPFWWVGPSGKDRVLVWVPLGGYNLAARMQELTSEWVEQMTEGLTREGFPYDVMYIRWSRGDNAEPDPAVSDQVRAWNETHAWPRFVIGTVHDAFSDLDQRHGPEIPEVRGDWTPYWVDGAGSSAKETSTNRASSDRLAQAEALWSMYSPSTYPKSDFIDAMRDVHLYDEHTWGASVSVTRPDSRPALEQWEIKQSRAVSADSRSRDLLVRALALSAVDGTEPAGWIDVLNTSSWERSDLVEIPRHMSLVGNAVFDEDGQTVPAQRLSDGALAIVARDVPAFGSRRFRVAAGDGPKTVGPVVSANGLSNEHLAVDLDPQNGGIVALRSETLGHDFVDHAVSGGANAYWYFNGDDSSTARSNGKVSIRVAETGPVLATLEVSAEAPGAYQVKRRITLVQGEDFLRIADLVDKRRLEADSYRDPAGKESVNFSFPFAVPDGQVRLQVPFGVVRPDLDQIPGACKNWFTIDRWADVANDKMGVTLVSLDTPLLEVGELSANLLNSQTNPAVWRKQVGSTQRLYVWAMNNHWGTNYRAYQEGPVTFRFAVRPHGEYDPGAASRMAIARSQPLLVVRADPERAPTPPLLQIDSPDVLVLGLKPSNDRRAVIVRLWVASSSPTTTGIRMRTGESVRIWRSGTDEKRGALLEGPLTLSGWELATLRIERL